MIDRRFAPVLLELQSLADRFTAAGHRLFLVGGTVRDIVLAELGDDDGAEQFDVDATTTARPDEIKRCLSGWADAIWTVGERFGTIGATKAQRVYEITTHRAEAYQGHSRKPDVEFSTDINADLSRRDFTVNAMAIELTAHLDPDRIDLTGPALVDPFGGVHDLRNGVLRTPLSPEASFSDDPLRMLRAARFIARYRLQPDDAMRRAVRAMGDRMQIVSAERIRDELDKLLTAPLPGDGLRFVADTGLMQHVVPELVAASSQADEPCHDHLWAHTIDLVDAVPAPTDAVPFDRRIVRLAALLRPLGGPRAHTRLRALRASNDDTREVTGLIELHAALVHRFAADPSAWTDGQVRRLVRDAGASWAGLLAMVGAEVSVHATPMSRRLAQHRDALQGHVASLAAREPLDDLGPQLDGAGVMAALGLSPGRAVGEAIDFLTELRLDEGVLPSAEVTRRLEEWWRNHQA